MRMYKFHYDNWIEGNVNFKCLRVFISEFDESVQSQPLLITFLGSKHGFVDTLFLFLAEFDLYQLVIT